GVKGFFDWLEGKAYKMHVRVFLSRFRTYTRCHDCGGSRLQPASLHYRWVDEASKTGACYRLPDWWQMAVSELAPMVARVPLPAGDSTAEMLRDEIASRLRYLERVGLGYLSLDRTSRTLSGGEMERVNLTTCLGASLVNTLFVLDEPSVGLHPRDVGRLNEVMHGLRDRGNTLLVVEHEEAVIRAADNIVEIGPGRGAEGGELVYSGPLAGLAKKAGKSLTADYLSGAKSIPVPNKRRRPAGVLGIARAAANNLKNVDVDIPLGVFCCVSGVSGSGKSTLVHEVLYENLLLKKGQRSEREPGRCREITGASRVDEVVMVDQSPLARTPRSTPAVYTGAFDVIRKLFAETPDAVAEGMTMGFFSFNSGGGRCERCWGTGFEKVEMQFLSDLFVRCPECEGKRYQSGTLKIRLHGKSLDEILSMTTSEAIALFAEIGGRKALQVVDALSLLEEVGLGYLRLGQPLNTLSGGESQRLKLVGHLLESRPLRGVAKARRSNLLIFDEPTTGLHFDDVALLLKVFDRLVEEGHSLLVIEHNLEVLKCAD
ncbi:MAG: excinuclease ABC subunit A, partial [Verrucomicrobiales bacterium]